MRATLEDWNSGWIEIELGLSGSDIDQLITLLQMIKADPDQHFHATSNFVETGGIGKVTFYVQQSEDIDNLSLDGGQALGIGEAIET